MMKLTREQLYKWVWSCPVTKIAEEIGVSGSGLGRKCKSHNVPTPGRGYWYQVQLGKPVQCLPLPQVDKSSDLVSIQVSDERAKALDLLPIPFAESTDTPAPSKDLGSEIVDPKKVDYIESSDSSAESNLISGSLSPDGRFAEQDCLAMVDPKNVMAMAALHSQYESAIRFIKALKEATHSCDAPTRAVLILWIDTARVRIPHSDPIVQVINECRSVALDNGEPGWWVSLQKR